MLEKADGTSCPMRGIRLESGSPSRETVRHWIAGGAVETAPDRPALTVLQLVPAHHIATFREKLPLRVMAHFSDGSERMSPAKQCSMPTMQVWPMWMKQGWPPSAPPGCGGGAGPGTRGGWRCSAVIPRAENPNIPLEPAPRAE